jgi:hypothetical protein
MNDNEIMTPSTGGEPDPEQTTPTPTGRLRRTVPAWVLMMMFAITIVTGFVAYGRGGERAPGPSPTVTVTATAPAPQASAAPVPITVEAPDGSKLSTDLVVCSSLPVDSLVRDASNGGGVFSPAIAPLEGRSAVWRWEMAGSGELVVVVVDTDAIDPSGLALLRAPGAVDALGGAGGVLDVSATANSGRWWVGIGTAFSVPVPLTTAQVTDAATAVAECMNGAPVTRP